MNQSHKIYIAGHLGMVGSAIHRNLSSRGFTNFVLRTPKELDLTQQAEVNRFFEQEKPDYVFLAAARVGGIMANDTYRGQFIYENLMIQSNVIHAAWKHGVKKLLFLGSSCIYPRLAPQPLKEEYLLTGPLEPTNEPYAVAKIAGIKMCESYKKQYGFNYVALMPTNLYGSNDNFDLTSSHVLPAMVRKFHEAKIAGNAPVTLWGTGTPMREFLYVEDLADAALFLMNRETPKDLYNVGTGHDISISQLATTIQQVTGHSGEIVWDTAKPDGTPRKVLDISQLKNEGWEPKTSFMDALKQTYAWFLNNSTPLDKNPF